MSDRKILVTGASGKLGSQVVKALLEELNVQPSQLIVTTRHPDKQTASVSKPRCGCSRSRLF
ncbi:hypothetical protein OGZ01_09800 [Vibrio harveyi]|nr:hypothetical protein [Vibrio harveyi]